MEAPPVIHEWRVHAHDLLRNFHAALIDGKIRCKIGECTSLRARRAKAAVLNHQAAL